MVSSATALEPAGFQNPCKNLDEKMYKIVTSVLKPSNVWHASHHGHSFLSVKIMKHGDFHEL